MFEKTEQLTKWQVDEILNGIAEADRGDFADDQEVESVLNKWIHPVIRIEKSEQ